jgi:hypothetical protein
VAFGHREEIGLAVHLPGAGEDDADARVVPAAGFENRQLAPAVDLEIRVRIPHAVDMAHLSRQVEDDLAVPHQMIHGALLADVGDVDAHPVGDAVDVEEVGPGVGDERVDQQEVGAQLDQGASQIAPDESEAARDHDAPAGVERSVVVGHRTRVPCLTASVAFSRSTRRPLRRTTSATHSFMTSMAVR